MKLRILVSLACLLLAPSIVYAEPAYVIDKLLVGIHQDKDLNSAIVKVLPTGTQLEVLRREGELAEVRDAGGATGWVDTAYLMDTEPAQLRVETLQREIASLKAKSGTAPTSDNSDRDVLTKENTELKGKLSAAKLKVEELQTSVIRLEAKVADRPMTPADTIIEDLEQQKQKLARELETTIQENKSLQSQVDATAPSVIPAEMRTVSKTSLIVLMIALVLAFGAGIYCMDYMNRRRHGGFRI